MQITTDVGITESSEGMTLEKKGVLLNYEYKANMKKVWYTNLKKKL